MSLLYNIHMLFGIYTNVNKDNDCVFTRRLTAFLQSEKLDFAVHSSLAEYFPDAAVFARITSDFDVALVIGGDGTVLRVAADCARAGVPILGFNCGYVGFLTESETDGFENAVRQVASHKFSVESRSMLVCRAANKTGYALNDIVVSRTKGKLISLDVYSEGKFIDSHYCDGFIISTPTGSTAYSLSAGGPIISPGASVTALTPINSHTLHSRPIVTGDDEKISVCLSEHTGNAAVYADGNIITKLDGGDSVFVEKAPHKALFVRLENYNFYEKLFIKLNKWGVVNDKEHYDDENKQTE